MHMHKIGKIIIAGIGFGLISYFLGGFVWGKLYAEAAKNFTHLFRAKEDPLMREGLVAGNVLIGIGVAWIYSLVGKCCECDCPIRRGLWFGLLLIPVLALGEGLVWYAITPVSVELFQAYIVHMVLASLVGGVAISLLYGDPAAMCCDMGSDKKGSASVAVAHKAPAKKAAPKKKKKAAKKRK